VAGSDELPGGPTRRLRLSSSALKKIRSNTFNFVAAMKVWFKPKALKNNKLMKECTSNACICFHSIAKKEKKNSLLEKGNVIK
jgi:hypothetical protein